MTAREAILRATLRIIGEHGVPALTNRRIAAEAGVSLGSLTYHFPSQTDVLRESMLLFAHEETARLAAIADRAAGGAPSLAEAAATVEQVLESMTFGREDIAPLELFLQAGRDHDLRGAAARCFEAYERLAVTVLTALDMPDPERLAGPVVALIAGLQLRRLATGEVGRTSPAVALTMLAAGAGL
ncbi:TetR/AcrR family transcriptional regulator [Fodinicola acaciae]|uniref:TetR/AcrR family transcriptional regulator n=1 Tax=Fodinicola acaciae TaxID=2681555 RepID=UPI0013D0CE77|nr:TetR/AcrR family transcriptional regulator [Fodinicola acaciae]